MNKMERSLTLGLALLFLLVACGPQTIAPTDEPVPTPLGTEEEDLSELIGALQLTGAEVEIGDVVEQPFFDVSGREIMVNQMAVEVYAYPDEAAREEQSDEIGPDGYTIGETDVNWISRPNFWADSRLIVLYVGTDSGLIFRLTNVLGDPITPLPEQPEAVAAAERALSQELNLPVEEIEVVSFRQAEWPDSCLGLGGPDEGCADVITPGWEVVLEIEGESYVAHTDESGEIVRFEE